MTETYDNIERNYKFVYELANIDKSIPKKTVNKIIMNPNTEHSIMFELNRNKRRLKNNLHRKIRTATNTKTVSEIQAEIRQLVFNKVHGQVKGDCYKTERIFITEHTRTRTQARLEAIENLRKEGYKITRRWLYTYASKEPRQAHLAANSMEEDERGYFIINGYRTKGPGLFGVASEDINCQCDTECYVETVR